MTDDVDLTVQLGSLVLKNPVIAASGTFGTGLELAGYVNPADLGAVTVKSLSSFPWAGNDAPRLAPTPAGMLNAVGLQNPGVRSWATETLPALRATGATVIVSVWGRTVEEFVEAARIAGDEAGVSAIELNLSCPNLESADEMFAHSASLTGDVVRAVGDALSGNDMMLLAKLSPNTGALRAVAEAAVAAGAGGLTLVNTVIGMRLDPLTGRPLLARSPSGLSGPAMRPIAVRCVYEVAAALAGVPIVGTGGVADGESAVEMLRAGAVAVGVGTASFYDPRATVKIVRQIRDFCSRHGVRRVRDLTPDSRDW